MVDIYKCDGKQGLTKCLCKKNTAAFFSGLFTVAIVLREELYYEFQQFYH